MERVQTTCRAEIENRSVNSFCPCLDMGGRTINNLISLASPTISLQDVDAFLYKRQGILARISGLFLNCTLDSWLHHSTTSSDENGRLAA